MSFNQHHSHSGVLREKMGRPLEMRDSAILDRAASSRRSRAHLPSVSDAKMTPWGAELQHEDDAEPTTTVSSHQEEHGTVPRTRYANHYQNDERKDQGGYSVPDVTPTHNHFQNRETAQGKMRLQMSSSRINMSHMSGYCVVADQCNGSDSISTPAKGANNNNNNRATGDKEVGSDAAVSSSPSPAVAIPAAGAASETGPTRKMATSRINASHGLFFQQPGAAEVKALRPGTPRCNRPPSATAMAASSTSLSSSAEPFQEPVRRGPVKNPWNGYTDAKTKFGGRIDKTSFW